LKYWFDQNKVFFGEPVQTEIIHGMREEGIDITIDLLKSNIRFGVQIKTFGDIQEKGFADKIHSQINRSRKHGLSKYIMGFAGDLTNESQGEKVSGIISEIHQSKDDNYVLVISPVNLLTICKVYEEKGNPSQFFNLNIQRVTTLGRGLSKALSNERREAKVSINFNYLSKGGEDRTKVSIKYALKKDEVSLLDKIENLENTDEPLVIRKDQIKEFTVTENGLPIISGIDSDLVIEREKKIVTPTLQAISKDEKVINTIEELELEVAKKDSIFTWKTAPEDEPCRFLLEYDKSKDSANFKLTIELFRGNPTSILKRLKFVKSLENALKLRILGLSSKNSVSDVKIKNLPTISNFILDLFQALALIQEKTNHVLIMPADISEVSEDSLRNVLLVSKAIKNGKIKYKTLTADVTFSRVQALSLLSEFMKKEDLKNLSYPYDMYVVNVLGSEIRLGPAKLISPLVKLAGDAKEMYADILKSKTDSHNLKLELMNPELCFEWFKKNPS
jgi:hypothetical protein